MKSLNGSIKKFLITVAVSLAASLIGYIFTFHNDVIAMKTEVSEKKETLKIISSRLDTIDNKVDGIYNLLLTHRK